MLYQELYRRFGWQTLLLLATLPCSSLPYGGGVRAADMHFGFARRDITPKEAVRLSGYGNRTLVSQGVDERLYVRAMALRPVGAPVRVLLSVETIGLPASLVKSILELTSKKHGLERQQVVVCCTHSHTAPQLASGLDNLLAVPLTEEQRGRTQLYTTQLIEEAVAAVDDAIGDLKPGHLAVGQGRAGFARNRRLLRDGKWIGFGARKEGATDHDLPVLMVTDLNGKPRGIVFNYACHCTTFGSQYNRVNGDWAGYAAQAIEKAFPRAVALCTIGCGGDQNPQRSDDAEKAKRLAIQQGQEIAAGVVRLSKSPLRRITAPLSDAFGFAGLPVERPSLESLRTSANDRRPQVRRHAQNMLQLHRQMGRLPETYPAPTQVWRFGDQLCMVFLGGEVVVDYALRLKREIRSDLVWVTAYANDVFGYVASEKVRREGGYEVAGSMIYYNQPGPWAAGTEEALIRRVHELVKEGGFTGPFAPAQALPTFRLPAGFEIGIVAAEPQITDPVSFAMGADGRLWVVEMGDYPRGEAESGKPGGRVRILRDEDKDGRFEKSTVFLTELSYPNSVFPWNGGVLVCSAPHILYAEDTDGDDRADLKQVLYTGFSEANPQHRACGFSWGLDNWLYMAGGTNNGSVKSMRTGRSVAVSSRDLRIHPATGAVQSVGGHTQFGRNRDDWGHWFGGSNSHPIVHFVVEDRYLGRNPFYAPPDPTVHLLSPPTAPPVFPSSRTVDRFNDLFALDRFTSACSPMIFRDDTLGKQNAGAGFVSEPVHNLVHRTKLIPQGVTYRGARFESDKDREFLASTDHWFRPTTIATGPDGALWVADMYRLVIEHPQWIPLSWQAKLDLRAGHKRGRIYRVFRRETPPTEIPHLAGLGDHDLVNQLNSSNGWRRDTAQRLLVERQATAANGRLVELLHNADNSVAKVHALGALHGVGKLTANELLLAMRDPDPRVQRWGVRFGEQWLNKKPALGEEMTRLADGGERRLAMQLALSMGEWQAPAAADVLARITEKWSDDPWIRAAVLSSAKPHAKRILLRLLRGERSQGEGNAQAVQDLITTAIGGSKEAGIYPIVESLVVADGPYEPWRFAALAKLDQALSRRGTSLRQLRGKAGDEATLVFDKLERMQRAARRLAADSKAQEAERLQALPLLASGIGDEKGDKDALTKLLSPRQSIRIQIMAVQTLGQVNENATAQRLLANWRQLSPGVQGEIISVLLSRGEWQQSLLDALAAKRVSVADLDAPTRTRLLSQGQAKMKAQANRLLGGAPSQDRRDVLARYAVVARLRGDVKRGRAHFEKACATCHRHGDTGTVAGPSLAALQNKSNEYLLPAVLDPNRAVEGKYKSYTCVTRDGKLHVGMIVEESAASVTLSQANGTRKTLLRVDIESLDSSGLSMMPEGLEKDLDAQALADIFSFIREVKTPAD